MVQYLTAHGVSLTAGYATLRLVTKGGDTVANAVDFVANIVAIVAGLVALVEAAVRLVWRLRQDKQKRQ